MICRRLKNYIPLIVMMITGCGPDKTGHDSEALEIAANEDIANYIHSFEGRGELIDTSKPVSPEQGLAMFRYPSDLEVDLVLAEPSIVQPVNISFDHRGRLWIVQYNQYPYPKGLKITGIDNHLRLKFDKKPLAPPQGVKGADKITFFEDTDHDGIFDKATDAITGLNIATSVALGRGKIWVLNPPYLVSYPDPDKNGIPNGEPIVELDGFGLEDTHAVANSLTWGPDGWLYGAMGSTTTANISSAVSKNVSFKGQAIWRYHPGTKVFELFAEGGGNNPFNLEIDDKGRIFSGSNGTDRGPYYKQGGYYIKSWGKHGPLTNPYAFGYLPNMNFTGEKKRFTHAMISYGGGSLPARFNGKLIAVNPLQNYVQLTRMKAQGSGFNATDEERILETDDHWFRPVDIKAGPDGAVYIADWYDSRLSHIDPRDTWDKSNGRIYRIRNKDSAVTVPEFDLDSWSNEQLTQLLFNKNKWFRQQALQIFGDRKDSTVIPGLLKIFRSGTGQVALEALWAINLSGGFNDKVAIEALNHKDPFVRMWSVRLLGDAAKISPAAVAELGRLSSSEHHPEVLSQLASSVRRLPAGDAIPIIKNLLKNNTSNDPEIPMLIWWAIESKVEADREKIIDVFEDRNIWSRKIVQETILKRLMQRYIMAGGNENYAACVRMLKLAPSTDLGRVLVDGLEEGVRGRDLVELPPDLVNALNPYRSEFGEGPLSLGLRQGNKKDIELALNVIADGNAKIGTRLSYIKIFGEIQQPSSVPVLIDILNNSRTSGALRQAALRSLQSYDDPAIGQHVVNAYSTIRADQDVRLAALSLFASRADWALKFLDAITRSKKISKDDVPEQVARRLKILNDSTVIKTVNQLWPNVQIATSAEKNDQIKRFSNALLEGKGDPDAGRTLFMNTCGACHKLFNKGGILGPDLTGYERSNMSYMLLNIVDPNADIREGYDNYRVIMKDGRTLEGRIMARHGESITLQPFAGKPITLSSAQILEMHAQQTSIMPERLLDQMTDQQIRDIFSYIKGDKQW